MAWLRLLPTIVTTLYEVYKILRDLSKKGVDVKECRINIATPGDDCK